jgi:ribosomal protein S18 acetylase RimI-like enzyme
MTTLRPIQLPADQRAVMRLDTSFTTDRIYRAQATSSSFTLVEDVVLPPLHKSFALEGELDADRMWDYGIVAEDHDTIVGFAAVRLEHWNRRAAIWHLYVAPQQRGTGLGRRLIDRVEDYARTSGARCLWLETSNVNYPAIQFYRHVGFTLCGLDLTLYAPDSDAAGETALYFTRAII